MSRRGDKPRLVDSRHQVLPLPPGFRRLPAAAARG